MTDDGRRAWLITGAAGGLGREIADAALSAGDHVMATARDTDALAGLARPGRDGLRTTRLDVTDPASVDAAVRETCAAFGRIDVLVNSAGSLLVGAVEEFSMAQLRAQMDVLFFGAVEVTKAVLPIMREQGSGTIVQMSSLSGMTTYPGLGAYQAAKWALEGLSETLATELAPLGVRVMIVEPGAFRTNFNKHKQVTDELPFYHLTSGAFRQLTDQLVGTEPNDPAKAAAVVLAALGSDQPPLRLPLGADAVEGIREHQARVERDVVAWEDLSRTTGFPAAG